MASAQTIDKLFTEMKVEMLDNDPGAATAKIVSADGSTFVGKDMRDYGNFAVIAMPSVASSEITLLEIVASDSSDMSTNLTVVVSSGTVAANAPLVDYVAVECTAEQIKEVDTDGDGLRYVAARITSANSGDEHVVTYIRTNARFPQNGLTANNIS